MGFRLKTSKRTMNIFEYLGNRINLQPFALSKIAIALSLKEGSPIEDFTDEDIRGLELNRQTIMGNYDEIFKALIEQDLGRHLSDDEYFPIYTKKHLDRGAIILKNKYEYSGNPEKLFMRLLKSSDEI